MTYGPQNGRLVPCSRSPHHGFHPESEVCGDCPVPKLPCYSCKQADAVAPSFYYCQDCLDAFSLTWGYPQ